MCGFIGRINVASGVFNPPLGSGLRFLRRRGPDSCRRWNTADGRVELIHARLAIVDNDVRADQPYTDPSSQFTVAFNGEVYNYAEVRQGLAAHQFRTDSDTEVLLATVAHRGLDGLRELRGMFSFALVDERQRRVILVRDPVGKKPLYVATWPGGVWFGSSLLALAASSTGQPGVVDDELEHWFRRGYCPPDRTLLAGARPLAPGEVLVLDWDGNVVERRDCFPTDRPARPASVEAAREELRDRIDTSLRRRLHNNPRPVSLLSGGTDSTVIATRMQAVHKSEAITLGSVLRLDLDEKYARYAAWREGISLRTVRLRVNHVADEAGWALDLQDQPLGMISYFLLAVLLREAKEYGKILLTGDGGDEVFLGYGRPADWTTPGFREAEFPDEDRRTVVGTTAPDWMSPWGKYTVGHALLGHHFPKVDRASAEQGVEVRCPLLDWDLIRFARSLPPAWLFDGGVAKGLLKSVLGGWPSWYVHRSKVGFAYRLRWAWGMRRYAGLREMVSREAVGRFERLLPSPLRRSPFGWRTWHIFRHFDYVWKLIVWTRFEDRLRTAGEAAAAGVEPFRDGSRELGAFAGVSPRPALVKQGVVG